MAPQSPNTFTNPILPDGFGLSFTLPRLWDGSPPPALPAEAEA